MPRLESPVVDRINEREAREAAATRFRDRISQYKDLLSRVPATPTDEHKNPMQEKSLLKNAIALHEEQLRLLLSKGPVEQSKSDQEVATLKDEVASLREALTEATMKLKAKAPNAA